MILLIDNYDSFTYNLYQYLSELNADVRVFRNDAISVDDALALQPSALIISPGPGRPSSAGISKELVSNAPHSLPILGVCLGHQAIGEVFGGEVVAAAKLMHGKTSELKHDGKTIFTGLPQPLTVMRYHSLILSSASIPAQFDISATNIDDGEVMAVRHKTRPIEGVQFHPESIMTEHGKTMLDNFLKHSKE
ncbi:MAG: anthranilate synthase component II [Gammaproteobacteria bacterium WSBS_2016_MAG_OTU1]